MATDLALDETDLDEDVIDFPLEVLTLEQFLRLPEIKPPLEFIKGRIEQKMSSGTHRGRIRVKLSNRINAISEDARLGLAFVGGRCNFGGESYVPDISYIISDRIPLDENRRLREQFTAPPDWSIEVLSPGETVENSTARLQRLVTRGVRLGWLIHPRKSRVSVFRPGQPSRTFTLGETLHADPVLPGFALPVNELFGWLFFPRG